MTPPRIVIIGGGIGGVALGAALHRLGVPFQIFEQASALKAIGYGLALQKNALDALDTIGIGSSIRARGVPITTGAMRQPNGRVLTSMAVELYAVHRATLLSALAAEVPASAIALGRRVVDADAPEVAGADLVVAADGLHSAFRARVAPGEPALRDSGYTAWRGLTPASPAIRRAIADGTVSETWGRGTRFGIVPIDGDRIYWFAVAPIDPIGEPAKARDHLLETFRSWHAPVRDLLEQTPAEVILESRIADRLPIASWHADRVVLLGDAAHPLTPNLGQGGCQAIEDAVVLAHLVRAWIDGRIARDDVGPRYEQQRQARVHEIVSESFALGRHAADYNPLLVTIRDLAFRWMPRQVQEKRFARVVRFPGVQN
jgi:2-polyprenyl-6-methoxyphenol hydroxylase-like FAD-dependent oxidoreductase